MKKKQIFFVLLCVLASIDLSLKAQSLYVGSNSLGSVTNLPVGTSEYNGVYIGYTVNASSNHLVVGVGATLANPSNTYVGYNGSKNTMVISNGGTVNDNGVDIGYGTSSANNTALITGENSIWNSFTNVNGTASLFSIGYAGSSNSMIISNGGRVNSYAGSIGSTTLSLAISLSLANSNNSVLVTGNNSIWSNTTTLYIGALGSGDTMVISNGGKVFDTQSELGYNSGISNTVQVTGSNSVWTHFGNVYVGYNGNSYSNTMVISNGGKVINSGGFIGNETNNSNNFVFVAGSNSSWNNSGNLIIGNSGSGNGMTIASQARVTSSNTIVGSEASSLSNTVLVTGAGSQLQSDESMTFGLSGTATVTLADGGVLNAPNIVMGSNASSIATLNIGTAGGNDSSATNPIITASVTFGNGTSTVNFNQTNTTVLTNQFVGGSKVTLSQNNTGRTILSASNGFTGQMIVENGTLESANNDALGNSNNSLLIANGGTFVVDAGVANTVGAVTLSNGVMLGGQLNGTSFFLEGTTNYVTTSLDGTGGLVNAGATSLLVGSNSYTGGSQITAGLLVVGSNSTLGATNGSTWINGGALDISGSTQVQNVLWMSEGLVTNGSFSNTAVIATTNNNTIAVALVGDSLLQVTGGTNVLTASNSYSSGTYLQGGKLIVKSNSTLGSTTGTTTIDHGAVLDLGSGTQQQSNVILNGGVVQNGSLIDTAIIGASGSNTVSMELLGSSRLFNIGGTNILTVSNSYTGGSQITAGLLVVGSNSTLGATNGSTWINGGALDISGSTQVQNALWMSEGLVTNGSFSNTAVIATTNNNTIAVALVGDSFLQVTGGTNVLTASNSYSSGTYLQGGELIVKSNSTLGSTTNTTTIANGALLDLGSGTQQQSNVILNGGIVQNGFLNNTAIIGASESNVISAGLVGTSSVLSTGGSILYLTSSSNSYTGGSVVDGASLVVTNGGTLGDIFGTTIITNGGILNLGGSVQQQSRVTMSGCQMTYGSISNTEVLFTAGTNTVDANIIGTSSVVSIGGTNILFGTNNTYTGGTLIANSAMVVTTDSQLGATTNSLFMSNAVLDLSSGNNTQGVVTLHHATIQNGILNVSSMISASGTNTILGILNAQHFSYDTNSTFIVGTNTMLNVLGDYTSTNSGTLQYVFTTTDAFPRIIVGGTATLQGGLEARFNRMPKYGEAYAYMVSETNVGTFSNIKIYVGTNTVADSFRRGRSINQGNLSLIFAPPASYTQVAQGPNQINVARALDTFIPATGGDELVVSTALDGLTDQQYPNAFLQISPALYTSMGTIAFNSAVAQYNEMVQRLGNIRVAGVGFSSMGMNDSPIMDDNKNLLSNGEDFFIPSVDNHWGFFVDGNGIFANVNINNQLPGYSAEGGGVTFGADYKFNQTFSMGLYTGYEGSQSKQSGGNFICDNGSRFGAFATYQHGGLFANGILGGDSHSYQVNRSIQLPGMSRTASSAPTAGELDSMVATGYDTKCGNFTFGPITSLQYTYFGLQPFTESGAQSLDLSVANANANSLVYNLGSHCFYTWELDKNILVVPQINLGWQHEFLQNPYALNTTFDNGASFTYDSTTPLRDSLYTGVGFTVNFNKKYDASFFYNASACNPSIMSQNFFVSLGAHF